MHYWAAMRRLTLLALSLVVVTALPAAAADSPEALLQKAKRWLEPGQTSTRRLHMTIRSGGEVAEWTAAQARGTRDGGNVALTVLLAPADLRGTALLVREEPGKPDREWMYVPSLRRVRQILPVDEFESFLNTELTYGDFGFLEVHERAVKTLGKAAVNGVEVVQVQETLRDQRTFTRIVTSLVPATGQPLKREYYDVGNRLWKVATFENVADVHGVPTAQRVRMEDVQTGFGSEYRVTDIAYGVPLPAELFDPAQLAKAVDSPLWR
ncbi:MAG: outer membrane lipoprotein-sorting protein [Candidatus Binatia bacterium]